MFCCQCENKADAHEVIPDAAEEETEDGAHAQVFQLQCLETNQDEIVENAESRPEIVEEAIQKNSVETEESVEKREENCGKCSPGVNGWLISQPPSETLPICCKRKPHHTVGEGVQASRALSDDDHRRIREFLACSELPGWKPISNMFGPKTTKKFMLVQEDNPIVLIKGTSPIKCKASEIFDFFAEPKYWFEAMKTADTMFIGGKILEVIDAHHLAVYAQFRTPPGIVNRDMCYSMVDCMIDEHTAVALATSTERADCPGQSQWKFVRGEIKTSGYLAKDSADGQGCELTYIVQVDPKGWVPTWVVNLVAADQADNVTRIAKYFANPNRRKT